MSRTLFWAIVLVVAAVFPRGSHAADPAKDAKDAPSTVYLHGGRDFSLQFGSQTYQGLLARELARQALLIAARDEMSCVTRDLHLGQTVPKGNCVELDLIGVAGRPSKLELLAGAPPMQPLIATETLKTGEEVDLAGLVIEMESRSRGSFVKLLESVELNGKPRTWNDSATVSPEVASAISEMNFVTQFRAACLLHGEIDRHGASPAVMAALAMVYANLGVLTELHWGPAHEVFTARSLLYAQRLVVSGRNPPLALTARAYAYTLAGLPPAALADLDALAKQFPDGRTEDQLALPALLKAYCRCDFDALAADKYNGSLFELATLLGYLAREISKPTQMQQAGIDALKAIPHCYRIRSRLADNASAIYGISAIFERPSATKQTLYRRLLPFVDLPVEARLLAQTANLQAENTNEADENLDLEATENFKTDTVARAQLIAKLAEATASINGQSELTWNVLARLIADYSFGEIAQRGVYLRLTLGAVPEEFLTRARPLYKDHLYAPLLESLRAESEAASAAREQFAAMDIDVSELHEGEAINSLFPHEDPRVRRFDAARETQRKHMDATLSDLGRALRFAPAPEKPSALFYKLCPESPRAQAIMVRYNWAKISEEKELWLSRAESNVSLLSAFAEQYLLINKLDKAEEALKKICKLEPTHANFNKLAENYKLQQKMPEWQATLEEMMKLPGGDWEHAGVSLQIANYHFSVRQWNTALPFAEAAAKGKSAEGLQAAATCHEALQNWREAEKYYREVAELHGKAYWFFFAKRTGQGKLEAATAQIKEVLQRETDKKLITNLHVYFALATDDDAGATKALSAFLRKDATRIPFTLHLALLHDSQQQNVKRDAVFEQFQSAIATVPVNEYEMDYPLRAVVKLLTSDLAAGGKAAFTRTISAIRRSVRSVGTDLSISYFLGRYCEIHGNTEQAKTFYLHCMRNPAMIDAHRSLAGIRLLALGVKPSAYKEALSPKP